MNKKEIINAIDYAKEQIIKNDSVLFEINVSERAFMFHFARYMYEKVSPVMHMDCEYNRHYSDIKSLIYLKGIQDVEREHDVFPDILIHQRLTDKNNILALEIKKFGEHVDADKRRLEAFKIKPFSYNFAVLVTFGKFEGQPDVKYEFI